MRPTLGAILGLASNDETAGEGAALAVYWARLGVPRPLSPPLHPRRDTPPHAPWRGCRAHNYSPTPDAQTPWRRYGLAAHLQSYDVYVSRPECIEVSMTKPYLRSASVKERPFPSLQDFDDVVGGYNAYSPPGDAMARSCTRTRGCRRTTPSRSPARTFTRSEYHRRQRRAPER